MKILFLAYDLPYPLTSGGRIRAYYLLKALARKHRLTLFSYFRREDQKQYLNKLKKICQEVFLFKRRPPWSWQNLWRAFTSPLPFASCTYFSPKLEKKLVEELKTKKYDFVHFESFYPALYLPLVKKLGAKTIMGNENLEYQVYKRYADQKPFPLRQLLSLEVLKMRLFEQRLWRLANLNLALSKKDAAYIQRATGKQCPIIPNGVDLSGFHPVQHRQNRLKLVFVGTLVYQANSETIKFFLKKIYPHIKKEIGAVKFILVSGYRPLWLNHYLDDRSIVFRQDRTTPAAQLFPEGDVLVAPMQVASGTNIKVLQAMAAGLPVVTTSLGAEGIEAKKERDLVVADDPIEFAKQVVKLLKNKEQRQKLAVAGRKLVAAKYDWKQIGQKLNQVYQEFTDEKKV